MSIKNFTEVCPFYNSLKQGERVATKTGIIGTVVYHGLDGFGISENDDGELTHMLREPYPSADVPCVGREFRRI